MKKVDLKYFIFTLSFSIIFYADGQQLPQYSQYINNHYLVNTASAGWDGKMDVLAGGRMQWSGFDNAPKTSFLAFSGASRRTTKSNYNPSIRISRNLEQKPISLSPALKHGYGGLVTIDQFGSFRKLFFGGTYAVHLPISKTYRISVGTKIGLSNYAFIADRAIPLNPESDNTYQSYISSGVNRSQLSIGAGIYLYSEKLFFGIATDDLSKDFVAFGNGVLNFDTKMHASILAGYKFKMGEHVTFTPAILAKVMKPAPVSFEPTVRFEYKEFVWIGASYRHTDALIGMLGCTLNKQFKIGYSFDYSLSTLRSVNNGSHEVVIGMQLANKKR